jgi:hypothetical protein
MKVETLRDVANNVLGYIETDDDGNQTLKGADGEVKGTYEVAGDHTRDKHFNIVAKGNVLRAMIC